MTLAQLAALPASHPHFSGPDEDALECQTVVTVDYENDGVTFWAAFRALPADAPLFVRWPALAGLQGGDDKVGIPIAYTREMADLVEALSEIDGWEIGDDRAAHPLIVRQVPVDE
jgi:hypothetical protein